MEYSSDTRTVFWAIALALGGLVWLVATTQAYLYGMPMMAEHADLWKLGRIPSAVAWLALVLGVFLFRGIIYPDSFLRAFFAAFIAAAIGVILFGPNDVHLFVVGQTVVYYAIGSGLMGMTFRSASAALFVGLAALAAQIALDVGVHLWTGALQLA